MSKMGQPLYGSVKDKILEMIETGKYQPGDQLPTEFELCKMFNVSRTTVRLALNQLKLEGHVNQVQGRGTFVSKSKIQHRLTSYISFIDFMNSLGLANETKIIEFSVIPASANIAKHLRIAEKDPVFHIIRSRYVENLPFQYSQTYISWKMAPGLTKEDCEGSLYWMFENKFNHKLEKCVEQIEPVLIDQLTSEVLGIPVGSLAMLLKSTTYNVNDEPLEYSREVYRGDRSSFILERKLNVPRSSTSNDFIR
ncbi:MAG TPA: GntR family transcriptional regulator [Bacilli bacterium]